MKAAYTNLAQEAVERCVTLEGMAERSHSYTVARNGKTTAFEVPTRRPFVFTLDMDFTMIHDTDARKWMADLAAADVSDVHQIQLNNPSQPHYTAWINEYQGDLDAAQLAGVRLAGPETAGASQIRVSALPTGISRTAALFRKGDLVQRAGDPHPYIVTQDVLRGGGSTTTGIPVPVHRSYIPVEGNTGAAAPAVGSQCTFSVLAVQVPGWRYTSPGQFVFDGPFMLRENV